MTRRDLHTQALSTVSNYHYLRPFPKAFNPKMTTDGNPTAQVTKCNTKMTTDDNPTAQVTKCNPKMTTDDNPTAQVTKCNPKMTTDDNPTAQVTKCNPKMTTDDNPTAQVTKFNPKMTTDDNPTAKVTKFNPKMTTDDNPTAKVTKFNPKMTTEDNPTAKLPKRNSKLTNDVTPQVTKSNPKDVNEPVDKFAEKRKLVDLMRKIAKFSDESLNLDSKLREDPEYMNKYVALLSEFHDQGGKIYNLPKEEIERQKQEMLDRMKKTYFESLMAPASEIDELLVPKNATFNAKEYLEKLKTTEGNYDCTNVKLTRTENVSPEHHFYGKKVKRKFQGQRQIAVEVKSHGIVSKKCTYEYFLDTKKPFFILSGVAGSGKSVILRELAFEFYKVKDFNVGGLANYELLVHYECRNVEVMNYEHLMHANFPGVCNHLGVDTVTCVIAKLKVLYVVDGWDEANSVSELVLKDILKRSFTNDKDNKSSIIFGTRPHAVQTLKDFLKSFKIPANEIDTINIFY